MQKNPGLRSRIAFHVPFADYSAEELCQIASLMAKGKGMHITDEAQGKLHEIFACARLQSDFGNGRYVRNIFEQAKMNMASRLMQKSFEAITDRDIVTITADDIVAPPIGKTIVKHKIGF